MQATRLLLLGVLLGSYPAAAQQPAATALVGDWQLEQMLFEARRPLPDSLQHQLLESPLAETNYDVKRRKLVVRLTLRPDGTYRYAPQRPPEPATVEEGSYRLQQDVLVGRTTTGLPASFHGQRIVKLTRRVLLIEEPIWEPTSQVFQQTRYRRSK